MKKLLFILSVIVYMTFMAGTCAADLIPGISLTAESTVNGEDRFLLVSINVESVTGLNSARVDVIYSTDNLELVNVVDDVDPEKKGRQNFLGANILSVHEIKESGVSEYAVSKIWKNGEAPVGSDGSGCIGLLVFKLLDNEETNLVIKRETLRLMRGEDVPVPEFTQEFEINDLTFDPNAG